MLLHAFQYLIKMLEKCKHASSLEDLAIWHVYLGSDGMENLMINIIYVTCTLLVQLYVQCLKYSHRLHQSTAYWHECQNHREQPIMYWLRAHWRWRSSLPSKKKISNQNVFWVRAGLFGLCFHCHTWLFNAGRKTKRQSSGKKAKQEETQKGKM